MKCLYYPEFEKLEVREVPEPTPDSSELLIRVTACGICGSELGSYRARSERRTPPLIMGHEFAGTVKQIGSGCKGKFAEDESVIANSLVCPETGFQTAIGNPHLSPNRQLFGMHRPGGFGEYVTVPEIALLKCPDGLAPQVACLAEPVANGVHVYNLVKHEHIEKAIVIGAGPIGLFCMQVLQANGIDCVSITETKLVRHRRENFGKSERVNHFIGELTIIINFSYADFCIWLQKLLHMNMQKSAFYMQKYPYVYH